MRLRCLEWMLASPCFLVKSCCKNGRQVDENKVKKLKHNVHMPVYATPRVAVLQQEIKQD